MRAVVDAFFSVGSFALYSTVFRAGFFHFLLWMRWKGVPAGVEMRSLLHWELVGQMVVQVLGDVVDEV